MSKKPIGFFIFTSLLIHLLLFFLLRDGWEYWAARKPTEPEPVWVALKKLDLPQPENVVDMPKPNQEQVPNKASAESLYNQKVKEETVRASPPAPPKPAPSRPQTASKPTPSQRIPGMPEVAGDFGSPADDFLPNYKVGNRTYLNTLAQPNVAYYVELKRKFRLTWNPVPVLRGQITEISRGKIDVVLGVSVNARGEMVGLTVIRSSGVPGYDMEGKRTVQASAPFSSPPANLLGEDGMLHMAWTFVVYL